MIPGPMDPARAGARMGVMAQQPTPTPITAASVIDREGSKTKGALQEIFCGRDNHCRRNPEKRKARVHEWRWSGWIWQGAPVSRRRAAEVDRGVHSLRCAAIGFWQSENCGRVRVSARLTLRGQARAWESQPTPTTAAPAIELHSSR